MNKKKSLQELTFKDNFMFGAVMLNPENCKGILERSIGKEIERVEENGKPIQTRFQIAASKRINIDYAGEAKEFPWRYTLAGHPFLSIKEKN